MKQSDPQWLLSKKQWINSDLQWYSSESEFCPNFTSERIPPGSLIHLSLLLPIKQLLPLFLHRLRQSTRLQQWSFLQLHRRWCTWNRLATRTAFTRTAAAVETEATEWAMDTMGSDMGSDSATLVIMVATMIITVGSGVETLE